MQINTPHLSPRIKNLWCFLSRRKWLGEKFYLPQIISLFSTMLVLQGNAQIFEPRFSDVEKLGFRELHDRVIGYNAEGYDLLRYKFNPFGDATLFADHVNMDKMLKTYSIEIFKKDLYKNNQIKHKIEFEEAFVLDSSLIVLFSSYNNDQLENELYAVQYIHGFQIGDPQQILEIKTPNKFEKGSFIVEYDLNQHVFAAIGVETDPKTDDQVFRMACYNQHLDPIWKQNLDIPYKENRYELEQMEVDDSNRVFMLFKIILNKDQQKQKNLPNADYYYSLLQLSATQDDDYLETVLNVEDKNLFNMFLDVKEKPGKIFLTGLYLNKKGDLKPKGVYFTEFKKDSIQPTSIKIQPFADDFIPDFETESPFTDISAEEPQIKLLDLIRAPDQGYYLLGEYILINETCMPDYRSSLMSCNYNYYYNDIFVFKFDSTGSLERKLRIPKKQFTRNDGALHSSFAYGILKNKLVLFYNDHPKNLKPKNPAHLMFMTDPKKSNLAAVTIDEKGLVDKEFIINNDKKKTWCKPAIFFNNQGRSIIMLAEKGRLFQGVEIK
jgi:hypothetical protein